MKSKVCAECGQWDGAHHQNCPEAPETEEAATEGEVFPQFRFIEFNPRRAARKVDAARIAVSYEKDGPEEYLWMSLSDVIKNAHNFGACEAFAKAIFEYSQHERGN